ncbi:PQQ-binding-like beta-propeller repeat protein [Intrasporangium calvum]|uniref:Pyrrolo-quinoline quinone repeat-containing protein n=1 Tax=Intrasporangium calvum (strain ATCC 23552 / DSM 43043 / JCM 3097 / NBRC 12989 / NCIMB 10167 / NRRL B-3866 / 7 KIP) TaxID=710696 RepID=E6S7I5_INTC7|nr:PQQ-binding-like beta-propeller repeat protein [Intrasporangium calvum]ADU46880.1 Pyrrolo-quinoline quinone repeat-containing protein [Intrasporangium calvum DSM 43043]
MVRIMRRARLALVAGVSGALLMVGQAAAAPGGNGWNSAGGDRSNTRNAASETKISPSTVGDLTPKWVLTAGGDVSATPAVDGTRVYVPDWAGNLYAVDRMTGEVAWQASIPDITGVPGNKARATPAFTDTTLVVGDQGPFGGGGRVIALDKATGAARWVTQVDSNPGAIITQSATIFDGVVYVGVASQEEAYSALVPGYDCCTFRGSLVALDLATGSILWKTYMTPEDFPGVAVWGSSPAVDPKRGTVYIATGNNYDVPQDVLDCVAAAGTDPVAQRACLPPEDLFDSIVALDMRTGAVKWATHAISYDAWTVSCIFGNPSNCPSPAGPDYDFGQAPALFKVASGPAKGRELLGAGQKSGQYWALDPDTGAVVWETQAGPGGTAGGLQWGSAVDGRRIYTANANSNLVEFPDGSGDTSGVWSALDPSTGAILWQTRPTHGGSTSGPATTANGVVFGCALDADGYMYALDAATGEILWSFESGGSCLSGAAISNGMVYWGSGYSNFGFGTANNKLYAFGLN